MMLRSCASAWIYILQEWKRSSKPDDDWSMKRQMAKNVQRMRQANQTLKRSRTNPLTSNEPLSDQDLLALCSGVVASGKQNKVKQWLSSATLDEKVQT